MGNAPSNQFTIGELLGGGGFGQVYRGTFKGSEVAIKRVQIVRQTPEKAAREYENMRKLDHPNVLKLLHVEDTEEFRYFILELCAASLADYISGKYDGRMPEERDSLIDMAEGVWYIHSKNLVHRDIKPDNVLIDVKDVVLLKISDFGCSKQSREGEFSVSQINGNQNYLAPEILRLIESEKRSSDIKMTNASDVFALGCSFYKFLTKGHHPFGQGQPFSIPPNILEGKSDLQKLPTDNLAYSLIKEMIDQSADQRPPITDICEALGVRSIRIRREGERGISCSQRRCYGPSQLGEVNCCSFHPTKRNLACGLDKGRVCLFSGTNRWIPFAWWAETVLQAATRSPVWCIDWKVDGGKLAAGMGDGTVVVWHEDGTKSFELKQHSDMITSISWNGVEEKSHLFVTGSYDKRAIVWDSDQKTALRIFPFHSKWINEVTWISAGVIASCSKDRSIKICQLGRPEPLKSFSHGGGVCSLLWNAEDDRLASCSDDGSIKIWAMDRQEPVTTLPSGGSPIICFDWHRIVEAGTVRWSIAGGCQNVLLVWDLQVNRAETNPRKLPGHLAFIRSVAFSPDGQFLASADEIGKVLVWCTQMWQSIFQLETKSKIWLYNRLRWNCAGTKLAIPNYSPEVHVIELDE